MPPQVKSRKVVTSKKEADVTRLHLPHAIVVRLHMCLVHVVPLTPETAGTVGV